MEKRLGTVCILISDLDIVQQVNELLSSASNIILARQGVPLRDKNIHFISLIIEGDTDQISSLTGKLGRLVGVEVKSMLSKIKI